ncbi:hypothetical protein BH11CYA1_BH11CYA1_12040 [soil metagenome]
MGQQTLDRPSAEPNEHKYKAAGPDKAIDCTDQYCKPISMEQLQKDLGPEQFKKYQAHVANDSTKDEYFHPGSDADKMMKDFSIENDIFDGKRNGSEPGKKESDKPNEQTKADDKPKTDWEKKIEASGAFSVGQAKDAYNAAAKEKDGVAIIIGGKDTPGSTELLEKLPQLQKENPNLKFMFVDKDAVAQKLAENPNDKSMQGWDKWIKENQKDCNGQPIDLAFTSVQSLKVDEKGNAGPDKVTSTHWTADISAGLQDQSRFASDNTAKNLANAKFDFTPPQTVPTEKPTEKPIVKPKEQAQEQTQEQTQEQEKEEPKQQAKEETLFLKDEKDVAEAKVQAAKHAQAAKDAQATKDEKKPDSIEQQDAAKLEKEKQAERQERIKQATDHKYSGDDLEKVKQLSKELGLPIIMEIGYDQAADRNPCRPCIAINGAMERGLADDFKGRALVMKSGLGDLNGNISQHIPGFHEGGGTVPYSNAGYVGTDGKIHTLGNGERGFSGVESWKANRNNEINQINKLYEQHRKNR